MTLLRWIFLAFAAYGLFMGLYGGAILSLTVWAFVCYASWRFDKQDEAWRNDPRNAETPLSTEHMIDEHCCECSGDKM